MKRGLYWLLTTKWGKGLFWLVWWGAAVTWVRDRRVFFDYRASCGDVVTGADKYRGGYACLRLSPFTYMRVPWNSQRASAWTWRPVAVSPRVWVPMSWRKVQDPKVGPTSIKHSWHIKNIYHGNTPLRGISHGRVLWRFFLINCVCFYRDLQRFCNDVICCAV